MEKGKKRKRVVLSIESKLTILEKIAKGVTQARVAEEYNIGQSTITDLKKKEAKLKEFASTLDNQGMSSTRKIMRLAKDQELEQALYIWFVQKRTQDTPVSGPLLREKASNCMKSCMQGKLMHHHLLPVHVGCGAFVDVMVFVSCLFRVSNCLQILVLLFLSKKRYNR